MSVLIVALDTSHAPGSAAVAEGRPWGVDKLVCENLPHPQSTARWFAVRIRELLRSIGARPSDVGLVAVDSGPGSFTGLRIAVTFAKTFAYATGADVLGVSSMDVLARQAAAARNGPMPRLWSLVDAHRGQLFTALYEACGSAEDWRLEVRQETRMIEIDHWLSELRRGDFVTGPVVNRLVAGLPAGVKTIHPAARPPSARAVAQVAWQRWQAGARDDLWHLRPAYIRRSAAEERRDAAAERDEASAVADFRNPSCSE